MLVLTTAELAEAVAKYCDEYICLCVCLPDRISPEPHMRSLPNFLCMLPMSVAQSSSRMFMTGRITYRREGVFFPTEMHYQLGKADGSAQHGQSMLSMTVLLILHLTKAQLYFY